MIRVTNLCQNQTYFSFLANIATFLQLVAIINWKYVNI